jgi:hypothetical protein
MSAFLAVCDKGIFRPAQQETRLGVVRVIEHERAADRQIALGGDFDQRRLASSAAPPILKGDRKLTDDERQARQAQELGEVPSGHIVVLRPIDREVAPPLGLNVFGQPIRRDGS